MRLTFGGVVRAEWAKLTSLRSTWIVLGVVAVVTVAVAGVIGGVADAPASTAHAVATRAFQGVDLFTLVLGVFGIVAITGEYTSGAIRGTFAAVPRRRAVLWAKALVLVAACAPVMVATCVAAVYAAQARSGVRVGLGDATLLRATFGAAMAPLAFAVLGLAIGAMLRHTAAAITVYVAAMLVVPAALPALSLHAAMPYSPVAAGQALYAVGGGGNPFHMLGPAAAAGTLVVWLALTLAGAATLLERRDA